MVCYEEQNGQKIIGDAVWKRLETYVFPTIGDKDVAELDTGDLLVPVKKVEALGYLEVAMRIQQYVTAILRHAVQQKLIRHNLAYDMEGCCSETTD
ncbi:MAG: Prophage integrase IntA [Candidatus Erwinia impunctatus]|nr:Prophage integrase IntA [Culicoides impunctatus]